MATLKNHLLVGTRKGLAVYQRTDSGWTYHTMHFLGIPVSYVYVDDRHQTWWACLDHGHWGVKLHRSFDEGKNWEEIAAPKYPADTEIKEGVPASTKYIWALTGGGTKYPDRLWLGTVPGGLFKSEDRGNTFELVTSLWEHPSRVVDWFGGGFDDPGIHSIVVDPRNNNRVYIAISCAGVFASEDSGQSWSVKNKGLRADYLPDPYKEVGQDPHLLIANEVHPDVMWQQNHCGIFRSEDGGQNWSDISDEKKLAHFGFVIGIDESDPLKAWVVPAISDEIRVAVGGSLCVCRTEDGGRTWQDFRNGLPQDGCFDIVYRHALDVHQHEVVFGTTCGNLFLSSDAGENWESLNHFLPMVYTVCFAA